LWIIRINAQYSWEKRNSCLNFILFHVIRPHHPKTLDIELRLNYVGLASKFIEGYDKAIEGVLDGL
jgi:hypothetical protein